MGNLLLGPKFHCTAYGIWNSCAYLNPDYARTELSEDLGLVVFWSNKDQVVDAEGHKKRSTPGLRAMDFV